MCGKMYTREQGSQRPEKELEHLLEEELKFSFKRKVKKSKYFSSYSRRISRSSNDWSRTRLAVEGREASRSTLILLCLMWRCVPVLYSSSLPENPPHHWSRWKCLPFAKHCCRKGLWLGLHMPHCPRTTLQPCTADSRARSALQKASLGLAQGSQQRGSKSRLPSSILSCKALRVLFVPGLWPERIKRWFMLFWNNVNSLKTQGY